MQTYHKKSLKHFPIYKRSKSLVYCIVLNDGVHDSAAEFDDDNDEYELINIGNIYTIN